jgi:hypothetical protein
MSDKIMCAFVLNKIFKCLDNLQVLRAFGIPQRKHLYFISVSGAFLGTSLPPTPNWSRFDLFIGVYSIFTFFFTLFIVFLATHCILFIFYLPFLSLRVKLWFAYAVLILMQCSCLCLACVYVVFFQLGVC